MLDANNLNTGFLLTGAIGLVVCFICWYRRRSAPWLVGIGVFGYLFISSIVVLWRNAHR